MIVVTTPTGQIGQQLVEKLLDNAEPVRVIARDPARLDPHVRERVEVVAGSHDDPGVVAEAFAGAEAVFWLVPPNPHAESVEGYYLDFTRPACEAFVSQGVKRVVGVTSLGRGYGKNAGNLSAAFAMDRLIESTGVAYRALELPYFMENLLSQARAIAGQGAFYMANAKDRTLLTVATPDIADVAAELLGDRSWTGQAGVPVVGPDELSPNEMAEVMTEVLGRPVRFQEVPGEAYKDTLTGYGLSEAWARGIVDMVAAQNEGIYDAALRPPQATSQAVGRTSFRKWCKTVLKPAVG